MISSPNNSYTTTQTSEHAPAVSAGTITLHLSSRASLQGNFDCRAYLNELEGYLCTYDLNTDPLSERLHKWGRRTVLACYAPHFIFDAEAIQKAGRRIQKLLKRVLINPLDTSPLCQPVLERHWTWEKWMLEDYQTLTTKSGFDQEEMAPMVPHTFAKMMLLWAHSFPFLPEEPLSSSTEITPVAPSCLIDRSLMQHSENPGVKMLKLFTYQQFIQAAIAREAIRELRYQVNETRRAMVEIREDNRAIIAENVERYEREAAEHEALIERRFEEVEEIHQGTVNLLNTRIAGDEESMRNLQGKLEETQDKCLEHERSIDHLRACYRQKAAEVEGLRNSAGKRGRCIIS